MRCYEAFTDNIEAIRSFNVGELDILAAEHVTESNAARSSQRRSEPDMTREDVRKMLATCRRKKKRLRTGNDVVNFNSLLKDTKTRSPWRKARRGACTMNWRRPRTIADREAQLTRMDSHYTGRQAGLAILEKDLADKDKEIQS